MQIQRASASSRPPRRRRLIAGLLGIAVLAGIGALSSWALAGRKPLLSLMNPIPTPHQLFGKGFIRVLVVGLDYDYDQKDQPTSAHSRSDVIMAVGLDLDRRRISELSIPRDMVAMLPNGRLAKINQAQSDGGIAESRVVVERWLGIPAFDRYAVLRIDAAKDVINAIGGIDLKVMNSDALRHTGPNGPVDYDDSWGHLHVHLKPGFQHLNGEQAVGYARFRHDWCSDPCRIMRQQQVMRALVARVKNDKLNDVLHINALLDVLHKDVQTNLTTQEELSLANAFRDMTPAAISTAQVPYVRDVVIPGYGDCIVADDNEKQRLVRLLLTPNARAAPGRSAMSATSLAGAALSASAGLGTAR